MTLWLPEVTVAIPTYQRLSLLQRAIDSVYSQTYTKWELVVSDDEIDGGQSWDYLQHLVERDSRVRVVQNLGHHGQVGNVNNALLSARGKWIKILYDDDRLLPDCLETFLRFATTRESIAVAACAANYFVKGQLTRSDRRGRYEAELLPQRFAHLAMYLQEAGPGPPTCVMVNRLVVAQGVLFEDVDGLLSGVDSDWNCRALRCGDLLLINRPLVELHQGGHMTVTSAITEAELDREYELLLERKLPFIRDSLRPPPLETATQMLVVIRALNRLKKRHVGDAVRLAVRAREFRAWVLAARWLLQRAFPGRFRTQPYQPLGGVRHARLSDLRQPMAECRRV